MSRIMSDNDYDHRNILVVEDRAKFLTIMYIFPSNSKNGNLRKNKVKTEQKMMLQTANFGWSKFVALNF